MYTLERVLQVSVTINMKKKIENTNFPAWKPYEFDLLANPILVIHQVMADINRKIQCL